MGDESPDDLKRDSPNTKKTKRQEYIDDEMEEYKAYIEALPLNLRKGAYIFFRGKVRDEVVLQEKLHKSVGRERDALDDKEKWRKKFYTVKNPEVVRCEIERYKFLVPTSFQYDQKSIEAKKGQHAKSEEECRQRWEYLLKYSDHDFVVAFRRSFFMYWLKKGDFLQIASFHTALVIRKKLNEISNSIDENLNNSDKLDRLLVSEYARSICLEKALHRGIRDEENCEWLQHLFEKLAVRIADLYRKISEKLRKAKFEAGEDVPLIYNILSDCKYESCIQIFMSNYAQSNDVRTMF